MRTTLTKAIPREWSTVPIGELIALEYGKSFPEKKRRAGSYAVYGSNGIVGHAHKYLLEERTIVVGRKGSAGKVNYAEPKSWPIDTCYYVQVKNRKVSGLDYIYFLLKWLDPRRLIDTTTKPGLNRDRVYEQLVPLPPIPVQERIVQILQKADEIRRKRKEALELADKMLTALFLEIFGDPATNPKGWPVKPIGDLVKFDLTHIRPQPGHIYMYLAPEHIESGTGIYSGPHALDGSQLGSSKHSFTSEHVLYCKLRPYLNKVVLPQSDGLCSTELVPVRPGPDVLREFLAVYLRLPFFVSSATQKSHGTKMPRFGPELMKREPMIVPPLTLQKSFCAQVTKLMESRRFLEDAYHLTKASFEGLLTRAFTGELTAEWEAANAEWIGEQQALYERLPRLLILGLIAEKAKHARRSAEVLVTALMKYLFLLQMEGSATRRRFYHFVPYHYGPFAREVYADLEKLKEEGLIAVREDPEEEKTRISLAAPDKVEEALAGLPEDLKEDVGKIIETYGEMDHSALLDAVYERYPTYARRSRLRHKRRTSK